MSRLRMAVIGVGHLGQHHARILAELPDVELVGVVDSNPEQARTVAERLHTTPFDTFEPLLGQVDAVSVVTPTIHHHRVASAFLAAGVPALVEKPVCRTVAEADDLISLASRAGVPFQVGHIERFNPAFEELAKRPICPKFVEAERHGPFTGRSVDIGAVLDLMIHDLDIILSFTRKLPNELRAAGISVLSKRVDIANVRLSFADGCVANLTASRVSTEQVRKLRLFQPGEYISLDYHRQDAFRISNPRPNSGFVSHNPPVPHPADVGGFVSQIRPEPLPVTRAEPLQLELTSFFEAVRNRTPPRVDACQAVNALRLAENILVTIDEHAELVAETLRRRS